MNKKGILGNFIIAIVLLIVSGIWFYVWWTTSNSEECIVSLFEQFWNMAFFLFGVTFLIFAIVILYSALRPVTGCFGGEKT